MKDAKGNIIIFSEKNSINLMFFRNGNPVFSTKEIEREIPEAALLEFAQIDYIREEKNHFYCSSLSMGFHCGCKKTSAAQAAFASKNWRFFDLQQQKYCWDGVMPHQQWKKNVKKCDFFKAV